MSQERPTKEQVWLQMMAGALAASGYYAQLSYSQELRVSAQAAADAADRALELWARRFPPDQDSV